MAIREIPKSYEYQCDRCNVIHKQENAGGHYTDSRPPMWSRLTLAQDAHDYQGAAVADGTIKLLLCRTCTNAVNVIVEKFQLEGKDNG